MDFHFAFSVQLLESGAYDTQTLGVPFNNRAHMAALWMNDQRFGGSVAGAIRYDWVREGREAKAQPLFTPTIADIEYFVWSNKGD